ncbi:MAG: hypothetical protein ACYC1M_01975 [Armatimonadota bacterium]
MSLLPSSPRECLVILYSLVLLVAAMPAVVKPTLQKLPKVHVPKTVIVDQITLGETRAVYGRYGLRSSLEGTTLFHSETRASLANSVELVRGRSLPRFDNVWDNGAVDLVERDFTGLRWNAAPSKANSISVNAYTACDDYQEGKYLKSNEYQYASLTTNTRLSNSLTLSTDHAYTSYRMSKNKTNVKSNGVAMHYLLTESSKKGGWSLEYERIDPSFSSKLGNTISDRERYRMSRELIYGKSTWSVNGVYFHNNVGNGKTNTTRDYTVELRNDQKSLFKRPNSVGSVTLRHHSYNGPVSLDETSLSTVWKDKVGDANVQAVVSGILYAPGQKNQKLTTTTSITASSVLLKKGWRWRPAVTFGNRQNRNDLYESNDVISNYAVSIGADHIKSGWSADVTVGYRTRDRAADDQNDQHKYANIAVSYKPAWMLFGGKAAFSIKWLSNNYQLPSKNMQTDQELWISSLTLKF